MDAIETPGQHAILYGDRGVGKSSLAHVATVVLEVHKHEHFTYRCDSLSSFTSIARALLDHLQVDLDRPETTQTIGTHAKGQINAVFAKADTAADRFRSVLTAARVADLTPSAVCQAVQAKKLTFVIDEMDALASSADRRMIAELIKQLSDSRAGVKLLVVGIAESTADLLAGHPSVHRHLKEVHLDRMSDTEVQALIVGNADRSKLSFAPPVIADTVQLSAGFPYFAQLIGLKCSEQAVANRSKTVFTSDLSGALRQAAHDAEETLRSAYESAIRSQETRLYEWIIRVAAASDNTEITSGALRAGVSALAGREIRPSEINYAFGRLVRADRAPILTRVSKGVYRFTDPRMKVYARLVARIGEV